MFLQVVLQEKDRQYHRFLWRNCDKTRDPEVYEFQRLIFGNTSSPFCSQYVLQRHAQTNAAVYREAAETVNSSLYVDDVLDSCETVEEAKCLRRQLSDLLAKAGFKLRKWASSEPTAIADVSAEDRLDSMVIDEVNPPNIKTLGVLWEAKRDVFTFHTQPPDLNKKPTKRKVISDIATLYDPLHFLSPFTVRAKILIQEIWTAGISWDDVLPDERIVKWERWVSELHELHKVAIPRCLRLPDPTERHLHLFSDASKNAYAAVAYLVCRCSDETASSCIVASKSRVSPLHAMTIPRLELMGAVLSTRLANSLTKTLVVDNATFWTDSSNVVYWVHSQSRDFKPFIANRVSEIHKTSNPKQWRHVPGEINSADLPTRGMSATELAESKFWIEGPEMLKADPSAWSEQLPNKDPTSYIDQERKRTKTYVSDNVKDNSRIDLTHYSDFFRLFRLTAWIQRFLSNCRLPQDSRVKQRILRVDELKKAEHFWLKQAQDDAFPNGEAEKSLTTLNPKRDANGLLRSDGRLRYAEELPKGHPVTRLIVSTTHARLGHGSGVEHLLTELRSRFWIVKGRAVARNLVRRCPECRRKFTAKPVGQMMAPLPKARLRYPTRAFDRVCIDYGGPYLTKQGRGVKRAKRYLCLFTCLTTRAVHLEMAYALYTDSFINAFTRMVSRRGTPSYVVSDNGTSFVSAERELRDLVGALDQEKISRETSKQYDIEWHLNPPARPHFKGVFEALIKSVKKATRAVLGDADVFDEELHTAICGAEHLMNSRPITVVSADPNDLSPLTPNHFLFGQLGSKFAPETLDIEEAYNPRKRWHRVQQLLGQFWRRWRRELLPSLNVRKKWFHPKHNLKEGDVVMVVEPNAKRGEWPLGIITGATQGGDGLVRVVKVKVKEKELVRPVHRLCPLEYADEDSQ